MAKGEERFEKIYSQGALATIEIWVDKKTGVNYVFRQSGNAGGMTVLLDRDANCRRASNTVMATALLRFRLRMPSRMGIRTQLP